MIENYSFKDLFKATIQKASDDVPEEYKVNIRVSTHFYQRCFERHDSNIITLLRDIKSILVYNYPLILYYTKLDTALPERGRLESDKYVICGDVINNDFVLRTIYWK